MPTRDQFSDGEGFLKALRDWFAGQALSALLTRADWSETWLQDAKVAYAAADAMIEARDA